MSQVLKEILRDYERDRGQANNLLNSRKNEVYMSVPRILEIERRLTATGLALAKSILNQSGSADKMIAELEKENATLAKERELLLIQNGYPPNYFTDIYKCGACRDTGYYDDNQCRCLKQKLINKHYGLSNLNKVLEDENFDTFNIRYYSPEVGDGISPKQNMEVIYKNCSDFINNFGQGFSNLLFYGKTGLGKTFLCNCIAKDLLDMGKAVLYVTAPQLFKAIEKYRFHRDEMDEPEEYVGLIYNVDLLIIDDLGTEFSTVVTSTEFFNIINTRLLTKKPVIISTNLNPGDFENQYSDRLTSRFFGYYKMMKFVGDDIRIMKKYKDLKK